MSDTYELMTQIRRLMDESGESPTGQIAMAILLLDERLREIERRLEQHEEMHLGDDA